jgi:hypothetical protein
MNRLLCSGHGERQEEIFAFRRKKCANQKASRLLAIFHFFRERERHFFGKQFLPCFLK